MTALKDEHFKSKNISTSIRNRNEAYQLIVEGLPEKRKQVFKMYEKKAPCTRQEISEEYLLPINVVSGRTTELHDIFLLVECGSKENRWTGKKNTMYRPVKNFDERIDLINEKFVELRDRKDKLVNDFNLGLSELSRELIKKEINKIQKQIKLLEQIQEYGNEV